MFFTTFWGLSCCWKNSGVSNTCQSNPAFALVKINKLKQQGWEKPFRHAGGARGGIGARTTWSSAAASASNLWSSSACHFPQFEGLRMGKFNGKWMVLIWTWNNGVTYKHWSRHRKLNGNILKKNLNADCLGRFFLISKSHFYQKNWSACQSL